MIPIIREKVSSSLMHQRQHRQHVTILAHLQKEKDIGQCFEKKEEKGTIGEM